LKARPGQHHSRLKFESKQKWVNTGFASKSIRIARYIGPSAAPSLKHLFAKPKLIFQSKKDTDNIGKRAKVELKYGNQQFVLDFKVLSGSDFF